MSIRLSKIKGMKRYLPFIFLLSACAASGPSFNEAKLPHGEKSVFVIYRKAGPLGINVAPYTISINGRDACKLLPNSFFVAEEEGAVTISSTIWDVPGTSRITIQALPKRTHYVRMDIDTGKAAAGAAGGMAGQLVAEGLSNTGGPFVFSEIDPLHAKTELASLKQDCL